ncbi:unnamed protein product [Soboliphyme baturini]|uniref:AGC-kinase C-terminal domain-containing protein n=1 Tax=Soboliphyme baturini TaxID=241478 RepID=A0A183IUZ1_9BILA|nr:unnamed protein product [Soboliphyme baturini]
MVCNVKLALLGMYDGPPDNPFLNFRTEYIPQQSSPFYNELPLHMFDVPTAAGSPETISRNVFEKMPRTEAHVSPVLPGNNHHRRPGYFEQLAGMGLGIGK